MKETTFSLASDFQANGRFLHLAPTKPELVLAACFLLFVKVRRVERECSFCVNTCLELCKARPSTLISRSDMNYKGYNATIMFDKKDNLFVGHVDDIEDIVGFHAESVAGLETAFHEAVDDYLAACAHFGDEPR